MTPRTGTGGCGVGFFANFEFRNANSPLGWTPVPARIAYLYSRYPVVSQTFCDSEMFALEATGFSLDVGSINPPPSLFRHERFEKLAADVFYPPPPGLLKELEQEARASGEWERCVGELVRRHDRVYGESFKATIRARNALYFARLFHRRGIAHVHVHFANRATHSALFLKHWAGIPYSFTAHAQDFMVDLGSDALLEELCREAEFVLGVSDYSTALLKERCPGAAHKISRLYNGVALDGFPRAAISREGPLRIISIGRLIEFKGFQHLIGACARLRDQGVAATCRIIGEGPLRGELESLISSQGLEDRVHLLGVLSQEAVKRELSGSDVFALPCIVDRKGASDILPTVITEAMACRLPVVSTRLVGVPEMVEHGVTGLLTVPGDEADCAEALARLAADREAAHRMGEAGRARAERLFALEVTSAGLAARFAAVPERPLPPVPDILVLAGSYPGALPGLNREISHLAGWHGGRMSLLAVHQGKTREGVSNHASDDVECLPDAVVLESEWAGAVANGTAETLLAWRDELGTEVDGQHFFTAARHALHLARVCRKRGLRHVHATRSDTALCAWMLHRLAGLTYSLAIEGGCPFSAKTVDILASGAVVTARADSTSHAEKCPLPGLAIVDRRRRVTFGPLKFRLPGETPAPDPAPALEAWYEALLAAL